MFRIIERLSIKERFDVVRQFLDEAYEAYRTKAPITGFVNGVVLAGITASLQMLIHLPESAAMFLVLPAVWASYVGGKEAGFGVTIVSSTLLLCVHLNHGSDRAVIFGFVTCLTTSSITVIAIDRLNGRVAKLQNHVVIDPLTGALNRLGILEAVSHELDQAIQHQEHRVVVIFDLDDFKEVNDLNGHLFGDEVLKSLVKAVRPAVASGGYIGRVGGDEFMMMLPDQSDYELEELMDRASARFSDLTLILGKKCTFSFGFARTSERGFNLQPLIEGADDRMYQRKLLRKSAVVSVPASDAGIDAEISRAS